MIEKKVIIIFLLIKCSQALYAIIDKIHRSDRIFEHESITTINCESFDEDNFIFRGRFPNILDILDKEKITDLNSSKIEGYKYVYFPNDDSLYNKYIDLFPNSTIFIKSNKPF